MPDSTHPGSPGLSVVGSAADLRFYGEHVAQQAESILLLGCGTGELALGLSHLHRRVVAVDASSQLLAQVERARQGLSAEQRSWVRLEHSDLRSLRLSERFDVVLVPHNGLSLFPSDEDLAAVLATVKHHLGVRGLLSFDVASAPSLSHGGGHQRLSRRPFIPHLRERRRDVQEGQTAGIRRWKSRQLTVSEVDAALKQEGFVVTERYGGFDERVFSESDVTQVVVAVPEDAM